MPLNHAALILTNVPLGVTLVAVGNEAVQLSFMRAHREGQPCPPRANIDAFVRYSESS